MAGNMLPWWSNLWCMQQTIPFSLDTASLSALEILNKLTLAVDSIISDFQSNAEEIQKLWDKTAQIDSEIADINADIANMKDDVAEKYAHVLMLINELRTLIEQIKASELQWDVTRGVYDSTMYAQRNMFNDVTVHGITCDDLVEAVASVDALADCGLNVRGVAVMGLWLVSKFDIPEYFTEITQD